MRIIGFASHCRRGMMERNCYLVKNLNLFSGKPPIQVEAEALYSTHEVERSNDARETSGISLAKSLASILDESPVPIERGCKTRMELKRLIEVRIKKKVKEQQRNGKFQNIMAKVICSSDTLHDAYDCVRLNSNVDLTSKPDDISFESLAEELLSSKFDVKANTFAISTKGEAKEILVFPNLKLRIVQEVIRIVLEVVYRPCFSKISHGCRSGRGPNSALRYISKEIHSPDWWFTLHLKKQVDESVLAKLFSTMEEKIEDRSLYCIIQSMFDAQVLNLEFGGFPKAQGLPQEGVLSPILMNVYLDLFDQEFFRIRMRYEALSFDGNADQGTQKSSLRSWFRRQLKRGGSKDQGDGNPSLSIHACRFMDEIFVAISGSKDIALSLKSEIKNYVINFLHLDMDETEILPSESCDGVRFLGILVRQRATENPAVKAVHKLKEKVHLFSSQKQELWDSMNVRIGKKWLAHGLKKVKESEIKHLADSNSILSQISHLRKPGMETDHWFKVLVKIWMQEMNVKAAVSELHVLAKYVAEPALPQELREAFHNFQKQAKQYITSETSSTDELLSNSSNTNHYMNTTGILAPVNLIKRRLQRYGLVSAQGYPRPVSLLILQDNNQIIDWFAGLVRRWLRWYGDCDNINEVKLLIVNQIRMSCIRTLAAKHRIHEAEIAKHFESDLTSIPSTQETELEMVNGILPESSVFESDEALAYGMSHSGLCLLSLTRMVSSSRPCACFVMGCLEPAPCVYTLYVMERQKFPGWKTGFSPGIHPSLNRRRIGLCKQHVKDLYLGQISLQSVDFGAWK